MPASVIAVIAIAAPSFAIDESVAALKTRPGVEQPFLLVEPDVAPVASVILFPGGSGKIKLWKKDPSRYGNNFLVRPRRMAPTSRAGSSAPAPSRGLSGGKAK